jgi:hypothetical protein
MINCLNELYGFTGWESPKLGTLANTDIVPSLQILRKMNAHEFTLPNNPIPPVLRFADSGEYGALG